MTFTEVLYKLLISPIELVLEIIFGLATNLFDNLGLSIIIMSLVMNILLLPLYKKADIIQDEEHETEKKMKPFVEHIKKTFSGDERYMMLQTYYRQNNYKPFYVLKGTLPLALEIPFFIAAYHFLSNLGEMREYAFGPISDLSLPDGLIMLGGININLLPVIMTVINILSSSIYTKGYSFREKVTLYGMALFFLVLLYDSPSGLVLYWTLNNVFSLVKNLFTVLKESEKILFAVMSVAGVFLVTFSLFIYKNAGIKHRILVMLIGVIMELPVLYKKLKHGEKRKESDHGNDSGDCRIFLAGATLLAVITGILIPSSVVASSPEEFVQLADFYSPSRHVLNSALSSFGTFVVWLGVFYLLGSGKFRRFVDAGIWALSGIAVTDYMFFGTNMGMLSKSLVYENDQKLVTGDSFDLIPFSDKIVNLLVVAIIALVMIAVYKKKKVIIRPVGTLLIIAMMLMSGFNIFEIQKALPGLGTAAAEVAEKRKVQIPISRTGKNVIVIMLDRAISSYVPYMFSEKPELEKQFSGFTYYPNAVSFGTHTNIGSAAIFGGFEYTPEEMNARADESLASKQNEALKVMPKLFNEAGYEVTVCDPVYAGYKWVPDLSIFDDIPGVNTYNTEYGQFDILPDRAVKIQNTIWKRSFFCYGLMKILPLAVQANMYQSGTYFYRSESPSQRVYGISTADGIEYEFVESFSVLCSLCDMTQIIDRGNTLLTLANQSTHQPTLLSEPEYYPIEKVDNTQYDEDNISRFVLDDKQLIVETPEQMMHYHINMASLIQLGKWMDYLRQEGVYDNTRIILVSDHGNGLHQLGGTDIGQDSTDVVMYFNTFLMVKDFNSETGFETDYQLMTNADVPVLAMDGLIDDPVNPYTGISIDSSYKTKGDLHLFRLRGKDWDVTVNNGNTFLPGVWYSVHDDIFDINNWEELGEW